MHLAQTVLASWGLTILMTDRSPNNVYFLRNTRAKYQSASLLAVIIPWCYSSQAKSCLLDRMQDINVERP